MNLYEYNISIQVAQDVKIQRYRVCGKLNSNMLQEIFGDWCSNLQKAFISFEEKLNKKHNM